MHMINIIDNKEAIDRLGHIVDFIHGSVSKKIIDQCINHIEKNTGSPTGCLRTLESYAEASGMAAWYKDKDLISLKNWFYVRAKLEYILIGPPYNEIGGELGYENRALHGLFCLISDCDDLIKWYSDIDRIFNSRRIDNVKMFDFWTKQFFIALRGEWDILIERSERIAANPPTTSREKKFLIDHQFYLALAKGDVNGMESIIKELVSPKLISNRIGIEGGFSKGLICTPAILYGKLAWRNGYQIEIDGPYVPVEWLPIEPLDEYNDSFNFMQEHKIAV